jgi:hypothetical protein
MDTIQITKQNAWAAHDAADSKGKTVLEKLLGKEVFSKDIKDRVRTFADACQIVGVDPNDIFGQNTKGLDLGDCESILAYKQLIIIVRALNEGWTPDWTNGNQAKYYPWFDASAGSGLSYSDYDYRRSRTRLSAPAFASKAQNWPSTQALSSSKSTTNFS